MRLGADPDQLERLAGHHDLCAAHLARVRTRLRAVDRGAWTGPAAARWWAQLDTTVIPGLVTGGTSCAAAARHLRAAAREQRGASLAVPRPVERRSGERWAARFGPVGAEVVVVLVPGVGTDLDDRPRLLDDAGRVWESLVAHAGSTASMGEDAPAGVAVVAWLGYDPPDHVVAGVDPSAAAAGAQQLAMDVGRLRAEGARRIAVVGHSYGALVATRASALGMGVDELVLLGAPGLGVPSVEDLRLPRGGRVWSAAARGDPISLVARAGLVHGPDPSRLALSLPTSASGHGSYLSDPTLLDAMAVAVLVPDRRGQAPTAGTVGASAP